MVNFFFTFRSPKSPRLNNIIKRYVKLNEIQALIYSHLQLVTQLNLFTFRIYISSLLHFELHWRLTILCFINVDVIMANNQWHSPSHPVHVSFPLYGFLCNRIFHLYSVNKWTSHKKSPPVGKKYLNRLASKFDIMMLYAGDC